MSEFTDGDIAQVRFNLLELLPGGNYLVQPLRGELVQEPTTIAALVPTEYIPLDHNQAGLANKLFVYITNRAQRGKIINGFKSVVRGLNLPQEFVQQLPVVNEAQIGITELNLMYARLPVLTLAMTGLEGKNPHVTLLAERGTDIVGNFNTLKAVIPYNAVNYINV